MKFAAFLLPFVLLVVGCGTSPTAATVNGQVITRAQIGHEQQLQLLVNGSSAKGITGKAALQYIVNRTLLLQAAQAAKFQLPTSQISGDQSGAQNVLSTQIYPDQATYQARLKSLGLDQSQVDAYVADSATAASYMDKLLPNIVPTQAQIAAYYAANKSNFAQPPQAEAYHILVPTLAQAQSLLQQLQNGANFQVLASKYSKDPGSAAKGGYLGWLTPGQTVAPFDHALFALKPGQMSGIVQSQFGYHIILMTGYKPAGIEPLDATVTQQITTGLQKLGVVNGIKAKATIKYYPPYK